MIRTGIPVRVWEKEDSAVMNTAIRLLNDADADGDPAAAGETLIAGGGRG